MKINSKTKKAGDFIQDCLHHCVLRVLIDSLRVTDADENKKAGKAYWELTFEVMEAAHCNDSAVLSKTAESYLNLTVDKIAEVLKKNESILNYRQVNGMPEYLILGKEPFLDYRQVNGMPDFSAMPEFLFSDKNPVPHLQCARQVALAQYFALNVLQGRLFEWDGGARISPKNLRILLAWILECRIFVQMSLLFKDINFKDSLIKDARKRRMSSLGEMSRDLAEGFLGWLEECLNDEGETLFSRLIKGREDKVLYEGMMMGGALILNSSITSLTLYDRDKLRWGAQRDRKGGTPIRGVSDRLASLLALDVLKNIVPGLLPMMK